MLKLIIARRNISYTSAQINILIFCMADNKEQFPFEAMIDVLQETQSMESRLAPIINQLEKKNMYWTYSCISTLHELLKSISQPALIKLHSLHALKHLLLTCEYAVLTLIEVYILPILMDAAQFSTSNKQIKITPYFVKVGSTISDSQILKISEAYVQLSREFIIAASYIKPLRTCEYEQIKQESRFSEALQALKKLGYTVPKRLTYFARESLQQNRNKYLNKLKKFEEHSELYSQFFLANILKEIQLGHTDLIELKKLLSFGDTFLTSGLINLCQDELNQINENFYLKRKYLNLLNEFVRWGDIEAIIMIQNGEFITTITQHIGEVSGELGLEEGERIYPHIKASREEKKYFYVDYLKCLQIWAHSLPTKYQNPEVSIKKLYEYVKNEKGFVFPKNIHLKGIKKEITDNLQKNKARNQKLIQIFEVAQTSKVSTFKNRQRIENILSKSYAPLQMSDLQNKVDEIKKLLKLLLRCTEVRTHQIMLRLTDFKDNWINYLDNVHIDEKLDDNKLEAIVNQGDKYTSQIQSISIYYLQLKKRKINLNEFQSKADEILKAQNEKYFRESSSFSRFTMSGEIRKRKLGLSKIEKIQNISKILCKNSMDMMLQSKSKAQSIQLSQPHFNQNHAFEEHFASKSRAKVIKNQNTKSKVLVQNTEDKKFVKVSEYQNQHEIKESQSALKRARSNHLRRRQNDNQKLPKKGRLSFVNLKKGHCRKKSDKKETSLSNKIGGPLHNSKLEKSNFDLAGERTNQQNNQNGDYSNQLMLYTYQNQMRNIKNSQEITQEIDMKPKIGESIHGESAKKYQKINTSESKNSSRSKSSKKEGVIHRKQKSFARKTHNENYSTNQFYQAPLYDGLQNLQKELKYEYHQQFTKEISEILSPPFQSAYSNLNSSKNQQKHISTEKNSHFKSIFNNNNYILTQEAYQLSQLNENYLKFQQQEISLRPSVSELRFNGLMKNKLVKLNQTNSNQTNSSNQNHINKKEIQKLHEKIKILQNQTKMMKTKLAVKQNQIKSMKGLSQVGNSFAATSKLTNPFLQTFSKNQYIQTGYQVKKQNHEMFKPYLSKIKGNTFRKSMLRMKSLIYKTQDLEIGCMSSRVEGNIELNLYLTSMCCDIFQLEISILQNQTLKSKLSMKKVQKLEMKKQLKIPIIFEVVKIPFYLPQFQLIYQSQNEQKMYKAIRLTIPLGFNKLWKMNELNYEDYIRQKHFAVEKLISDQFTTNLNVVKMDKVKETFPNFVNFTTPLSTLKREKEEQILVSHIKYEKTVGILLIHLHERMSYIEGYLLSGSSNQMEFMISTLRQVLSE